MWFLQGFWKQQAFRHFRHSWYPSKCYFKVGFWWQIVVHVLFTFTYFLLISLDIYFCICVCIAIFRLSGNPICAIGNGQNISLSCGSEGSGEAEKPPFQFNKTDASSSSCSPQSCPTTDYFEYVPSLPNDCFCALPFGVELRLRSPSISDFPPYRPRFENFIAENVRINLTQLDIESVAWEKRRLRLYLKFFPTYSSNHSHTFSNDEVQRIANLFATFNLSSDEIFGPYDLLSFTLHGPYATGMSSNLTLLLSYIIYLVVQVVLISVKSNKFITRWYKFETLLVLPFVKKICDLSTL